MVISGVGWVIRFLATNSKVIAMNTERYKGPWSNAEKPTEGGAFAVLVVVENGFPQIGMWNDETFRHGTCTTVSHVAFWKPYFQRDAHRVPPRELVCLDPACDRVPVVEQSTPSRVCCGCGIKMYGFALQSEPIVDRWRRIAKLTRKDQ